MIHILSWHDDENRYRCPDSDPLGVLSSTQAVVEQGEHVWINLEPIEKLCIQWVNDAKIQPFSPLPQWFEQYHFFDGTERSVNWLLLLDALNFCFWGEKGQQRWTVEYQGETLNGYWAESASLKRAIEEGLPLWDANYLSTISAETVAHIFRGNGTIPLFEQRVQHTREVGQVLLANFGGQFANAIEQTNHSAVALVLLLARSFPSFKDITTYHSQPVAFLKRAQICIADLYGAFRGNKWGAFNDLADLTIFADYKLPQVLRHYNILSYTTALAQRVDNQEPLTPTCEAEVEIRACTIWACELLRQALSRHGQSSTAVDIDQKLWLAGQQSSNMHPYHRTRTVYY